MGDLKETLNLLHTLAIKSHYSFHTNGRGVWMWADREWEKVLIWSQRWSCVYLHNSWRRYAYTQEMRWDTETKGHISSPLCSLNQYRMRGRVCVCDNSREREIQSGKELAGSIWHRSARLRINMILWHLITLPIIVNQSQCDVLHIYTYLHTYEHKGRWRYSDGSSN